jgi:hypothetical protein
VICGSLLFIFQNSTVELLWLLQTVVIIKTDGILGMSIVGGKGQTSHPFGITEPGIFVSKVCFRVCYEVAGTFCQSEV